MNYHRWLMRNVVTAICLALAWGWAPSGHGATKDVAVATGELRSYSTLHSIGFEWDVTGDTNHNATCIVQYRPQGVAPWKPAMNLLRVDWDVLYGGKKADKAYNMLAGSIMFLDPGATYEIKLALADPDGGKAEKTVTIKTRAMPVLPQGGRTLHMVPGAGGGDGSAANPFKGFAAAQAAAQPGDIVLVHKGDYGNADSRFKFEKSGAPDKYLVWKTAGDGEATLAAGPVAGSHLWFEGLVFKAGNQPKPGPDNKKNPAGGYGIRAVAACTNVVVSRCRFSGYHYSIWLSDDGQCSGWYIADNEITGDNLIGHRGISGECIELWHSSNHDVCYNRMSRAADGISYPGRNCDLYGNDIRNVTDDGIELDYGYANNRIWGNRIMHADNSTFSFQPMFCGPWYFVRNEVVAGGREMLKANVADRFVMVNNTLIGSQNQRAGLILKSISRNNLWIQARNLNPEKSSAIWAGGLRERSEYGRAYPGTAGWDTDVDYDGFDWGQTPVPFRWSLKKGEGEKQFNDLPSFSAAVGIEQHAIRVYKEQIFEISDIPAYALESYSKKRLTLKKDCNAVDAGVPMPNLSDDFTGKAPDLGAYEFGRPVQHYGPREEN